MSYLIDSNVLSELRRKQPDSTLGRVLPVNAGVADCWGRLLAQVGRPLSAIDSLFAATALHHDLALVTRNVTDVVGTDDDLIDPWDTPVGA